MIKNMLSGFVRIHILHHASLEAIYGVEIIKELKRHGYRVGPGTVYPVLHQMEDDGYLLAEKVNVLSSGKKYSVVQQITAEFKRFFGA